LRPYYGKAYFNLGRLYMDQKKNELAWEHFKKATQGDLDTVEGFFTFGQISLKLKKYAAAAEAFTTALERGKQVTPEQRLSIVFNLANSCFMDKQYDRATTLFNNLCKLCPKDHRYLYNLGETLYSKKAFKQALPVFEKLANPPFSLAQANFRYASCLEREGRLSDAKQALSRITKAKQLPEKMKTIAMKEMGRLTIQEKINRGNCTLTSKDLMQAFNLTNS